MSPEVMNCADASTASDMWGVGCITYQLLSGGISPFFAVNRFRTMARYARYYLCGFFVSRGCKKKPLDVSPDNHINNVARKLCKTLSVEKLFAKAGAGNQIFAGQTCKEY